MRATEKQRTDRLFEEKLYEQVAIEISNGTERPGLWAKALADSEGDANKARSLYIKYRVQSMKDEMVQSMKDEIASTEAHQAREEKAKRNREKEDSRTGEPLKTYSTFTIVIAWAVAIALVLALSAGLFTPDP